MYLLSCIHKLQNATVVEYSVLQPKFLLNNTLLNTNAVRLPGSSIRFKLHDTLHSRVRIQTLFSNHRSHPNSTNPKPNTALWISDPNSNILHLPGIRMPPKFDIWIKSRSRFELGFHFQTICTPLKFCQCYTYCCWVFLLFLK